MKKIIPILIPIIVMSASSTFAAITEVEINENTQMETKRANHHYIIMKDNLVYAHFYNNSARHPIETTVFDVGSHKGTQFICTDIIPITNNDSPFFGLCNMQFKGDSRDSDLFIDAAEDATAIAVMDGFTVDGLTMNFGEAKNFLWSNKNNAKIYVKNGGVLNFNITNTFFYKKKSETMDSAEKIVSFRVEKGSELTANMGKGNYHVGNDMELAGKFYISNEKQFFKFHGTTTISNQITANASVFNGRWDMLDNSSILIDSSNQAGSIGIDLTSILIRDNATITLNASNALKANGIGGQDMICLEVGLGKTSNLILGADNNLRALDLNNNKSVLNVTLNGHKLSLASTKFDDEYILNNSVDTAGIVYFTDFAENLVKIDEIDTSKFADEATYLVTCFRGGTALNSYDLYWNPETKFLSATAVPEPAEWAMIFGTFALGFVVYRRRK